MIQIHKYPRTQHIQGSRLQAGDEDLSAVPFKEIAGRHMVVEEKMDGANAGISVGLDGELCLQSRGHYLTGGAREKHFDRFKSWAYGHAAELIAVLGQRYVMYGEWLFAKHTIFYNALPHYFMEFDVLDKETGQFLSTSRRKSLLKNLPFVHSVAVLKAGLLHQYEELLSLLGPSLFISEGHIEQLTALALSLNLRADQVLNETDRSNLMEGLYLKVEDEQQVIGRYKYVRAGFLQAVSQAEGHWLNRPIVPNALVDEG